VRNLHAVNIILKALRLGCLGLFAGSKREVRVRGIERRQFLYGAGACGMLAALERVAPSYAWAEPRAQSAIRPGAPIDLVIAPKTLDIDGRPAAVMCINGTLPGPVVRLREGQEAVLRVTNRLNEIASIHWHGVIVPEPMDGVPGVSFAGIKPGETFTYRFPVVQSGTYWCHSHSGGQELLGVYAPLIIDPAEPEPFAYDRDAVVVLSDWSFESPMTLIRKLKKQGGYFNFQRRTAGDFFADVSRRGFGAVVSDRMLWSRMRMDPTDVADVTGSTYTYLMNGLSPATNWTTLFRPGERVRLRFIAAGAMTYFDVRIPGLSMTLVQADGQNVRPVEIDEFRIAPGETYDVIVQPTDDRAYTIFAETMDRSGYARGTLAPRRGMSAAVPARRPRPLRTMADMGMGGTDMPGMDMKEAEKAAVDAAMPGMAIPAPAGTSPHTGHGLPPISTTPVPHGPDTHGAGNSLVPMSARPRLDEAGGGLENTGTRVLVYADLEPLTAPETPRRPEREIELHLTGNMERYMWSIDGRKYSEASTPIPFRYGERLRLTLVNDTMMEHPMHLHGMWMELENPAGGPLPRKHTISVKPAERLSVAITADAPGRWAFHCHLLLHMEMGMFRVIEVSRPNGGTP